MAPEKQRLFVYVYAGEDPAVKLNFSLPVKWTLLVWVSEQRFYETVEIGTVGARYQTIVRTFCLFDRDFTGGVTGLKCLSKNLSRNNEGGTAGTVWSSGRPAGLKLAVNDERRLREKRDQHVPDPEKTQ